MYMEEDGWRNEDDEGPYCPVLRTKGPWTIIKYINEAPIYLRKKGEPEERSFASVTAAKLFVSEAECQSVA
jgi:hypothetical protein